MVNWEGSASNKDWEDLSEGELMATLKVRVISEFLYTLNRLSVCPSHSPRTKNNRVGHWV